MPPERGGVYSARFPHASGGRGKKRPVVVVQADVYNNRLPHAVVIQITTNLDDVNDPACYLIEAASVEGQAAGLQSDSLVSAYRLALMTHDRLQDKIGRLTPSAM